MVDLQGQAVVALLTRAPSAGGKTRLFAEIGCVPDADVLAALLLDTLDAARCPGVTSVVCFTPRDAEAELRAIVPADVMLVSQRGEDLGVRMRHAFDDLLARGATSVVLIGSDVPGLDSAVIQEAHRVLDACAETVVLGPARDGGYYLIGATRTPTPLLDPLPWGMSRVLEDTERRARACGFPTHRLPLGEDIDTLDDLRRLVRGTAAAVRTRRAVTKLAGTYNF
jgi:uncharacterized protein